MVPTAAAGSLFAGFMSVSNLAYAASYGSGGWLYDNGMAIAPLRGLQRVLFGIGGGPGDKLSLNVLILIGSVAYFACFIAVHLLPERDGDAVRATPPRPGPSAGWPCRSGARRAVNGGALRGRRRRRSPGCCSAGISIRCPPSLATCLGVCLVRKALLDALLRRRRAA